MRKRKEREEQEVERVRSKARRKEAIESYQALLVETIKDPQVLLEQPFLVKFSYDSICGFKIIFHYTIISTSVIQVSWTEAKPKLEKDPQGRAGNPYLDQSDLEKLFREHIKLLHDVS